MTEAYSLKWIWKVPQRSKDEMKVSKIKFTIIHSVTFVRPICNVTKNRCANFDKFILFETRNSLSLVWFWSIDVFNFFQILRDDLCDNDRIQTLQNITNKSLFYDSKTRKIPRLRREISRSVKGSTYAPKYTSSPKLHPRSRILARRGARWCRTETQVWSPLLTMCDN